MRYTKTLAGKKLCFLLLFFCVALSGCAHEKLSNRLIDTMLEFDIFPTSIEVSVEPMKEPIVIYSEREKRLLEWSAEHDDKPIVDDEGTSAKLYVLKSEEQLREIEALPDLENLYISRTNIDLVLSSPTLKMVQFDGEFLTSDAIAINLSGCTALTDVALNQRKAPRELKLPDSVETLSMGKGLVEYADYLSTLPNLRKLTPSEVFDLSLLNGCENLETLVIFGDKWDLSALTNEHISAVQLDSQEVLDSFVGLAGLRSIGMSDRRISDISRIIEYAPNLETLILTVPESLNEVIWRGDIVDASNAELLDSLGTSIPIEQLKALVTNGGRLCIWGDPNH